MPKASPKSYREMSAQLEQLLAWFEGDNLDLDEAVAKHQQAVELIKKMEAYLKTAENKVRKLSIKV